MLQAHTQEAEKVMGLEPDADDHMTKPFRTRELRVRVEALLRRAGLLGDVPRVLSFRTVEASSAVDLHAR